jgi:hypothetical protein
MIEKQSLDGQFEGNANFYYFWEHFVISLADLWSTDRKTQLTNFKAARKYLISSLLVKLIGLMFVFFFIRVECVVVIVVIIDVVVLDVFVVFVWS